MSLTPFSRDHFADTFFNDPIMRDTFNSPMIPSTFGSLTAPFGGRMGSSISYPVIDVSETDSGYLVKADLPGLEKENIKVSMNNNVLTIEGERTDENVQENTFRYLSERRYGKFTRSFTMPSDVNAEQVNATMNNGVLCLTVGKMAGNESGRKRIEIS